MKFYYVYVLKSLKDNKNYIGFTNNLLRRYAEHQQGKNVSTAKRLPLELIFYEAFRNKEDALRREEYLKTTKGKVMLRVIMREYLL